MKIKMKISISGLYNGSPIPPAGEIWETDKNNAVDLIEKGWAEPVKSAPKKTASKPAGKEKS
jgi:hypothetical protein|tara:strand:+ start:164 stop:349 length:186 start_codon:yes stop_codon:yes gene_type:complete